MAQMNFGGVVENVMTREEFPLEKAREILKDETIAVIGYGVQGPGAKVRLTIKRLRTDGFRVRLCSVSRRLATRPRSSCACCPTLP